MRKTAFFGWQAEKYQKIVKIFSYLFTFFCQKEWSFGPKNGAFYPLFQNCRFSAIVKFYHNTLQSVSCFSVVSYVIGQQAEN
ncbi:hypothetical protein ES703_41303 [subsurface metagenome]